MRLVRQDDQARGASVASNRFVKFLRLQRRGARIRVFPTVHNEERSLQFVSGEKWGNLHINIRRLPNGSTLVLKAERRERLVVRTAGCCAGAKQVAMSHQIYGH